MNVSIIGTGYVGLTTGVCLAYLGHKVTCLDTDERKIQTLCAGKTPIYEPHLSSLMALAKQNLTFTTAYAKAVPGAEVIFIAVGTPPQGDGTPDLQYLRAAAEGIGQHFDGDFMMLIVVLGRLMMSSQPNITKGTSSNPVAKLQGRRVHPGASTGC